MADDRNLVDRLIALGEERLESVVQELVTNPKVMRALSSVMQRTQQARNALTQSLQQMYTWVNLPTEADLAQLVQHVEKLEARLSSVSTQLDRVLNATAPQPAAAQPATDTANTTSTTDPSATTKTAPNKKATTAKKPAASKKSKPAKAPAPKTAAKTARTKKSQSSAK